MRLRCVCILVGALAIPLMGTSAWSQGQITREDLIEAVKNSAEAIAKERRERGFPPANDAITVSLHCDKLIEAAKVRFSECMERETGALMTAPEPAETIASAVVGACRPILEKMRQAVVPYCMRFDGATGVSDRIVLEHRESSLTRIVRSRANSAK